MRILHVLDHSLPLQSGYAFRTAAILREQRALGWDTIHLTTPRQGATAHDVEEAEGWVFHRTSAKRSAWSRVPGYLYLAEMSATARRIDELVKRFHPDILHAHSPVLNALPALRVGARWGIPVVYEVRALWEEGAVDHGTTSEGSIRYRLSRALETYALRRADHVTTICEGLRGEILTRGVAPDRLTVIPNAVDTGLFHLQTSSDGTLRRQLGLDGALVIGFAGSFFAYEGLDLLIQAFALLAPQHPRLRLLLVGGGPQEDTLKSLVQQHDLSQQVIFAGRVPHGQVQRYYDVIDVLAYPRHRMRLTELVTPLKPLEAMAQGRMLVASDVGGHRELIRDGETGFLFPAGDPAALASAIAAVLARRADWPRLKAQARHFVESERSWHHSVRRYADVYGHLMAPDKHVIPA